MQCLSHVFLRILLAVISLSILPYSVSAAPNRPFPQHTIYAAGTIRPTNFTQDQQDQHVRDFYNDWKSRFLVTAGNNTTGKTLYRVAFGQGSDVTVSEGQGFGMVIVALMAGHDPNAQTLFDGLWYFARKYPSGINNRLMTWKVQNGAAVGGNNNAFDGDIDIAYGLLLAHEQWGSSGAVNYQAEAKLVIDAILASTIGKSSFLPKLGDWTSDSGSPYNQYTTRSSDFMLSHFRAFAEATQNTAWLTVIQKIQAVIDTLQANYSSTTGLLPDFIIDCQTTTACRPAYGGFLESANDGAYYYNAGRDPWRIGLDALLNNDAKSKASVVKMIRWLSGAAFGSASNIKAGYQLNGTPIGNYTTSFFIAPFGVGAMLDSSQQSFLNSIYALIYNRHENYYEDSVNLLSLLAITGNYWKPGSVTTVAACADKLDNDKDGKIDYPNDPGCSSATDNDETDPPLAACTDGIDNDGDGKIDYPADPGCTSATDTDESNPLPAACADGIDNDKDGKIDYPADPGCSSTTDTDETDPTTNKPITVQLKNTSDWGSGYCADVTLTNPNSIAIDWKVTFTIEGVIYNIWNATYQQTGNQVTAEGVAWNNLIQPNQSAVLFGYCANRTTTSSFALTVAKAGTGTGTVTSSPAGINCGTDCTENYTANTVVALAAVPASGSKFSGWSGACSGTGTCNVTLSAAKTVTATFDKLVTYTLTASKTGSGTISSNPLGISCGTDCSEAYVTGTVVTLMATPATNYQFTGWSGACSGTVSTCTVSLTAAKSVTANFQPIFVLTTSKTGAGSGTITSLPGGVNCGSDCSEAYLNNTTVTLTATAATGSKFTSWSGACSGTTTTCTVSMTAAKSVTATFVPLYNLTVTRSGTGTGTVTSTPAGISCGTDCTEAYPANTSVTLKVAAASGSRFTGWSGACTGTATSCVVSMAAVKTVNAAFAKP